MDVIDLTGTDDDESIDSNGVVHVGSRINNNTLNTINPSNTSNPSNNTNNLIDNDEPIVLYSQTPRNPLFSNFPFSIRNNFFVSDSSDEEINDSDSSDAFYEYNRYRYDYWRNGFSDSDSSSDCTDDSSNSSFQNLQFPLLPLLLNSNLMNSMNLTNQNSTLENNDNVEINSDVEVVGVHSNNSNNPELTPSQPQSLLGVRTASERDAFNSIEDLSSSNTRVPLTRSQSGDLECSSIPVSNQTNINDLQIEKASNHEENSNANEANDANDPENACPICYENITNRTQLDGCSHVFCWECIRIWSEKSNTCPMCRKKFKILRKKDEKSAKIRAIHVPDRIFSNTLFLEEVNNIIGHRFLYDITHNNSASELLRRRGRQAIQTRRRNPYNLTSNQNSNNSNPNANNTSSTSTTQSGGTDSQTIPPTIWLDTIPRLIPFIRRDDSFLRSNPPPVIDLTKDD